MKKILSYLFVFFLLFSCTSNTIFEKPNDLIPKDSMSLLLQEMFVASSAKFVKNLNQERNLNYMPVVYNKFKIDSSRFYRSNNYYVSKIDLYQEILENVKKGIETKNDEFKKIKKHLDSIKKDSITKIKKERKKFDSLKIVSNKNKDSIKNLLVD